MASVIIPSIKEQQQILDLIDPARRENDILLQKAQKAVKMAEKLRYLELYKYFGQPTELYPKLRRNPTVIFSNIIKLKNGDPDADFWIMRSGERHRVGKPFLEDDLKFVSMESSIDWADRPRMLRGDKRSFYGRMPRKGLDPRNHIGVTILRQDLLIPKFLYYVAEFAWQAKIYGNLCHGALKLQHIRQRDIQCALTTILNHVNKKPHRRNPDEDIRKIERLFQAEPSKNTALQLYAARKRAGDPLAGAKYYQYLLNEIYEEDDEDNVMVPNDTVYRIENDFYCEDCGFYAGLRALDDDIPESWFPDWIDHSDHGEHNMEQTREYIAEELSYPTIYHCLLELQEEDNALIEIINNNEEIRCKSCDEIIKPATYPVPWQEALMDNQVI